MTILTERSAREKRYTSRAFLQALNLIAAPRDQTVTVWGMKCVGYDFKFEKHLTHSLREIQPSSSSKSAGKRKAVTGNGGAMSEGKGEGKGEGSGSDGSSPPKRQMIAKGKVKLGNS